MKKITILTAALLALGMSTTAFAADIHVTVEGVPVAWTDVKPFINEDDRTLVPLRPIANALGLEVTWNDDTNTASFTDGESTVAFTVGSNQYHAFLNGYDIHAYLEMDTTPVIADSRIYAPARYLAESFYYEVGWDQATQTVAIVKAEDTAEEPEEETVKLPEVPAGQLAAAFPMETSAGMEANTLIAFGGVSFKEDVDFFEYEYELNADIEFLGKGMGYAGDTDYLEASLQPALETKPGTYPVSWTLPAEWFEGMKEDVTVGTTITVTAPTLEDVLQYATSNTSSILFAEKGSTLEDVTAIFLSDISWIFDGTVYTVDVTDDSYDETNGLWTGTMVISDGTDSAEAELSIPVEDPDEYFS